MQFASSLSRGYRLVLRQLFGVSRLDGKGMGREDSNGGL
jgi:hypothetical protein